MTETASGGSATQNAQLQTITVVKSTTKYPTVQYLKRCERHSRTMDEMEKRHRATVQVLWTNRSRSKERRIDYLRRITNRRLGRIASQFTATRERGCLLTIHSEAGQELSTEKKQRLCQIPVRKPFSRG